MWPPILLFSPPLLLDPPWGLGAGGGGGGGGGETDYLCCIFFIAPSSPPSNVTATVISPTSIVVTWDMVPSIDQNGVITMYEVLYEPLETFNGSIMSNTTTVDGSARAVNLTGLEEYVNFNISVRAYTSAGEGPYIDGVITMYQVLYQPLETLSGAIGPLSMNVTELTADLTEYVNYTISVRVYTSAGEGPYSDGVIELTDEDSEFQTVTVPEDV